jgi:hypothetical protein
VEPTDQLLARLRAVSSLNDQSGIGDFSHLVIEDADARGMPAGHDLCALLRLLGQLQEICSGASFIKRSQVKLSLCGSSRATDTNVNAAVRALICGFHDIDESQVKGTKRRPGPCHGMRSHCWPALAVILTHLEMQEAAA